MPDTRAERLQDLRLQVQIVKSGLRFLGAIVNECFWWSNSEGSVAGVTENGNTNDNECGKDQQKSSSNMDVDVSSPTDSIMTSKEDTQEKGNIDKSDHLNLDENIKGAETNSMNVVPSLQLKMPQPDDLLIKAPGMTEQLSYLFVISLVRVISWRKIVPDYFDFLDFHPPSSSSSAFHSYTWTDALKSEWKNVVEFERVGNVKELLDDVNEVAKDLLDVLVEEDDQKPIFDLFSSCGSGDGPSNFEFGFL
ncbi:hypothetical protein BKA69DRAFT_1082738 [Paraphysoderma sedebokerense]|nr:hypothetical protein BKA69DRAFT_1082684 [Paraphysoderma sedebokerense]KAI9139966.1 hypothetical protein BKA69DRAFT_1082738 [Paraphysoderma sedebokerense]